MNLGPRKTGVVDDVNQSTFNNWVWFYQEKDLHTTCTSEAHHFTAIKSTKTNTNGLSVCTCHVLETYSVIVAVEDEFGAEQHLQFSVLCDTVAKETLH